MIRRPLVFAVLAMLAMPGTLRAQPSPAEPPAPEPAPPAEPPAAQPAPQPDAPDPAPKPDAAEPAPPDAAEPAPPPAEPAEPAPPPAESAPPPEPPAAEAAPPSAPAEPAPPSAPAETAETGSAPPSSPAPAAPEPEPEPEEITVVGTRTERTPGSAHIVRERQLERFEYDDPGAILQQVPGVYLRQEDGIGLRPNIGIRGVNPDRSKKITLMEDGILFGPAPYSAPAAYYFPLVTRMTQVRVIKGPSAIAYGPQTVGGAVDLVTRSIPTTPAGALDLGVGEYGYLKAHAHFGASTEQFGFLVEGVHLHNDGFKKLSNDADTGSTRNEWMAKASYLLDPRASTTHEFGLKLGYTDEVSNETYLGLTDRDFRDDPLQRYPASALDQMKNHRTSLVLSHVLEAPRQKFKLVTRAYRHDYARVWRKLNRFRGSDVASVLANPDDPAYAEYYGILRGEVDSATAGQTLLIGPNDRTFVSQGLQSVLELGFASGPLTHRLEGGVRLHYDSIERRHSEDAFVMLGGELYPEGAPTVVTEANFASSHALAAHVMDAMTWDRLTLTPGVRFELIQSKLEDRRGGGIERAVVPAVMPGVGAYYGITDALGALFGVYRGFSPPPPGSEDHVEPEYSVNYEGGLRMKSGPARAEIIGFFNDYSNLTDVCTLASGCVGTNLDEQFDAGAARIFGFEAYLDYEVPLGEVKLPLGAAYTLTRAQFENSFRSQDPIFGEVEAGDRMPYVPEHQLGATIGFEHPRGGVVAGLNYVSRMREQASDEPISEVVATDEQFWVDVGGKLEIVEALSIYANVRNLFDAADIVSRRPYGARPNAPRWVQVGLKAEL